MSDTELDDYEDQDSGVVRTLRQQAKDREREAKDAVARAEAAERRLSFLEAGIDLSDPKNNYFVKGYEGEISPEAIRAEAEKAGFLAPPKPEVPAAEMQEHQAAANLSAGAGFVSADKTAEYHAALARAGSQAEILNVMREYGSPVANEIAE
jgi:hypothetical protein